MQSKLASMLESFANIAIGFILSLVVWHVLAAWYGIPMPLGMNVEITTVFTIVSLVRSYWMRRAFNWWHHRRG